MKPSLNQLVNVSGPILLLGESGSGKTYHAEKLHNESNWSKGPFAMVNLATISDDLLESELFGHVRGSFTGAISDKMGHIEAAKNGTLFLDEIGELSLSLQKKLLMFIDTREYFPVGSTQKKRFNGRIIVATNKNLRKMEEEGKFRKDLLKRLMVFVYEFTPLRQDKERLRLIINEIWRDLMVELRCNKKIAPDAFEFMMNHTWGGNIREIKNTLRFVAEIGQKEEAYEVPLSLFPEVVKNEGESFHGKDFDELVVDALFKTEYYQSLANFEKIYFRKVLTRFGGRINDTAKIIGLSKVTLLSKIKKYNINAKMIKALHWEENREGEN